MHTKHICINVILTRIKVLLMKETSTRGLILSTTDFAWSSISLFVTTKSITEESSFNAISAPPATNILEGEMKRLFSLLFH